MPAWITFRTLGLLFTCTSDWCAFYHVSTSSIITILLTDIHEPLNKVVPHTILLVYINHIGILTDTGVVRPCWRALANIIDINQDIHYVQYKGMAMTTSEAYIRQDGTMNISQACQWWIQSNISHGIRGICQTYQLYTHVWMISINKTSSIKHLTHSSDLNLGGSETNWHC